jgi:hypothetical protein
MSSFRFGALLVIFLVILSCEFEPAGTHFTEIPPPDVSAIAINLTDDSDTLFLYEPSFINFRAIVSGRAWKDITITLANQQLMNLSDQAKSSFYLNTDLFESGVYDLQLKLITSSGTGSLADQRGAETLQTEKHVVVVIDKEAPAPIEFVSIQKKDGTLQIKWKPYKKHNFSNYVLGRMCYDEFGGYYQQCWTSAITNVDSTTYYDSTFIGGKSKYIIAVVASGRASQETTKEFSVSDSLKLSMEWNNVNEVRLSWRKATFYNNLRHYKINVTGYDEPIIIADVSDTTITVVPNQEYPSFTSVRIEARAKYTSDSDFDLSYIYDQGQATIAKSFPEFYSDKLSYIPATNKYYVLRRRPSIELLMVDGSTHEILHTKTLPGGDFIISPNGEHIYTISESIMERLDPYNLEVTDTYDLGSLLGDSYYWVCTVSNNNILAANSAQGNFVVDVSTSTILMELTKYTEISPSGEYIVSDAKIYKRSGNDYTLTHNLSLNDWQMQVKEIKGEDKLLMYIAGTLRVFDLETGTREASIINQSFYYHVDPVTGMIGSPSTDFPDERLFTLLDPAGTNADCKFTCPPNNTQYDSYFILANNQIIWSYGWSVPVSTYCQ